MRAAASSQQTLQCAAAALDAAPDTNWATRVGTYDAATGLPKEPPGVGLGGGGARGHWLALHLAAPAPVRGVALRPPRESPLRFLRDVTVLGAATAEAPWETLLHADDLPLPPDGEALALDLTRNASSLDRGTCPTVAKIAVVVRRNHGHATAAIALVELLTA